MISNACMHTRSWFDTSGAGGTAAHAGLLKQVVPRMSVSVCVVGSAGSDGGIDVMFFLV